MAFSLLVPNLLNTCRKQHNSNFLTEGFQTDSIQTNQEYISTLMSIGVKATTMQLVSTDHLTQLTVSKNFKNYESKYFISQQTLCFASFQVALF